MKPVSGATINYLFFIQTKYIDYKQYFETKNKLLIHILPFFSDNKQVFFCVYNQYVCMLLNHLLRDLKPFKSLLIRALIIRYSFVFFDHRLQSVVLLNWLRFHCALKWQCSH